ncbi:MAG: hypothetical protein Q8K98_13335 [Bacteroidota bacterium]|nr:hypothetical protein [Bacteroidota bacterium]
MQPNNTQKDILSLILEFVYTTANFFGHKIVEGIIVIFPNANTLYQLTDPIGLLAIITIILIIAQIAKKVAWVIVGVGWVLILVRIVILLLISE